MKRLFFDIETSPNVAYVWQTGYKITVPEHSIVREKAVICICFKWEHQKRTHALQWSRVGQDKRMLEAFCEVANDADELVAHNGLHFDLPWLRGRCMLHGLSFPAVPMVDTCAQSRSQFKLNSNSLDYLAKYLGVGAKKSAPFSLWDGCMKGRKSSLQSMVDYCKHDVNVLERVFKKLQPYLRPYSHAGVNSGLTRLSCPVCGSKRTGKHRRRVTAAGLPRVQMRCRSCGKFFSLPETVYERLVA